jgi:alkanesulfonate monooxygenase SsuD/methylene tetrahydromethanopterin reductase-like flavin-dependent oxidoreductase (luciferase family)
MEFGILFTSHPNAIEEPYPHRDVHARVTDEIIEAERLGYNTAWIAEHHSLLLHYPPYYGWEKTMKSLKLFAERVIPPLGASRGAMVAAG